MNKLEVPFPRKQRKYLPTKEELCCLELLKSGRTGVSKLTMLGVYGETCLPTTISILGLQRGVNIARERRSHRHQYGGTTYFTWYWLPSKSEAEKVLSLIWEMRKSRGGDTTQDAYWQLVKLLDNFPA